MLQFQISEARSEPVHSTSCHSNMESLINCGYKACFSRSTSYQKSLARNAYMLPRTDPQSSSKNTILSLVSSLSLGSVRKMRSSPWHNIRTGCLSTIRLCCTFAHEWASYRHCTRRSRSHPSSHSCVSSASLKGAKTKCLREGSQTDQVQVQPPLQAHLYFNTDTGTSGASKAWTFKYLGFHVTIGTRKSLDHR